MRGLSVLLDALFPPRDTNLLVREMNDDTLAPLLAPTPLGDGSISALFPYRDPNIHALIIETKYYGNTTATRLLGTALAEYLLEYVADTRAVEKRSMVLVPLPLSGTRRRERGYNQIQKVLDVAAAQILEVSIDTSVLTRTKDTIPQTRLGKQARLRNVSNAFAAHNPNPEYLYIVVDDVYTTGATLTEALRTLREAGATDVLGLALAW